MLFLTGFFALALGWGASRCWIVWMRKARLGQHIRKNGPDIHLHKQGTPTMGGVVFLLVLGLFWALNPHSRAWPVLASTLAFAGVGLLDDVLKFVRCDSLGLRARHKVLLQGIFSLGAFWLWGGKLPHALALPGLDAALQLSGLPLLLWFVLVFGGSTNAFNLTDGLDGLAGGIALIALVPLGLIAAWQGRSDLVALIVACGGSVAGFLWFNRHPARLFMGDTGSFALGAFVAAAAISLRVEAYLVLFALIPVLETLSVALQVTTFHLTRRRIFKVAPLHHHFEAARGVDYPFLLPAMEWPEARVTLVFWLLSGLGALLGLSLYPR